MPTVTQVPPPWPVIRLAARMGTPYEKGHMPYERWIGAWLDWLLSRPSALLHQSATACFLAEFLAAVAIVIALIGFWLDLQNREEDRVNRAWSLVATAKEVQGNVGLIEALETLNSRSINMSQLQVPKAYLFGAKLSAASLFMANLGGANLGGVNLDGARLGAANLAEADLRKASLVNADLSGANLNRADLRLVKLNGADLAAANLTEANLGRANLGGADLHAAGLAEADLTDASLFIADLSEADLRGANLSRADLRWANLDNANLDGTNLRKANLRGTNLRRADNLTEDQLNGACGDSETKLPPGLTITLCQKE
jgi:uncharacterized protein YjbI with pentapeptide repeats